MVEVVMEKSQRKGIVEVRLGKEGDVYRGERLLVVVVVANVEW
jgi:hypothetical protein